MKKINNTLTKFNDLSSLYGAKNLNKNTLTSKLGYNFRVNYNYIKKKSLNQLSDLVKHSLVGKDLQELIDFDISFICNIKTYKGLRHKASLPVRGQRTHTNAKTRKKHLRKEV